VPVGRTDEVSLAGRPDGAVTIADLACSSHNVCQPDRNGSAL
jgi:hypothetical protein